MLAVYENLMTYIMNWNARTFPDATLEGQINKLQEEMTEYKEAKTNGDKWHEIADIFIVLGGLRRWNYKEGLKLEKELIRSAKNEALKDLLDCIFDKMIINLDRKWKKTGDGEYHHTTQKAPTKHK